MLLMIDNYDSFTYNLVQYFGELGADVRVFRNDQITLDEIAALAPQYIVVSPGPGTPQKAGISVAVIRKFSGTIPILGVCLGHQSIAAAFGGEIVHATNIMHGKTSQIHHDESGLFQGLSIPFEATRYHSLIVAKQSLPPCLKMTAWTQLNDNSCHEIMGLKHKQHTTVGVQFHPESILTQHGHQLLRNFLDKSL